MSIFDKLRGKAKETEYSEAQVLDEEWIRKDGQLVKLEAKDDEDAQKGQ